METISGADMDVIVNARKPTVYRAALEPTRLRHRNPVHGDDHRRWRSSARSRDSE
jgi:hypothetical protein